MINGGNNGISGDYSFGKLGTGQLNQIPFHPQAVDRSELGRTHMETEGRGYSDFYRNTSEELFLKSFVENSVGMPATNMEMLGFKNLSQNFRADSEELFKNWLTNGENHGCPTSTTHRTRQPSRRLSTEATGLSNQQAGVVVQKKIGNESLLLQQNAVNTDQSSDLNPNIRNVAERQLEASHLYLAKEWFNSSHAMTRSRSSELRKRYVAMQNSQTPSGMESILGLPRHGVNLVTQHLQNPSAFGDASMCETPNQYSSFISPSNSSSSTFNAHQIDKVDKVSSVVSMLKDTLERKKLSNQSERGIVEESCVEHYGNQELLNDMSLNQGQGNHIYETPQTFYDLSSVQVNGPGVLQEGEMSLDMDLEGFVSTANVMVSREPSQSESSAAAPAVSNGFDVCDGPSYSGQAMNGSLVKQFGSRRSPDNGSSKDLTGHIYDNLKGARKKGLVRYGSVTSTASEEKGDPTKKRRVERSRKMAEAKERNLTPPIPPDMQSILKRCDNLEKEVRSLKLNLSFMNRKDSEQTKQIEELQKLNEELTDEKERLLEEIERIVADTGKI